jgi:hypothetical protein
MHRERRTIQSPKSDGDSTEEVVRYLPYVPPSTSRRQVQTTSKVILVAKS